VGVVYKHLHSLFIMGRTKHKSTLGSQVRASAKKKTKTDTSLQKVDVDKLIPTGSTLLNLAMSDRYTGGAAKGKVWNIVGDSHSGKTFLALSVLAECAVRSRFDNFRFIYDDAEAALEFDVAGMFGQKVADRLEAPMKDVDGAPCCSNTVEDFLDNVEDALESKKPCIYILDSLDAVDSEDDQKKAALQRKERKKGTAPEKIKGSYGMAKPKKMSELFRKIVRKLKTTDSLLIIISQTRDDINPMTFTKKTRSGGRALEFYASFIIWLALLRRIKKNERLIGAETKVKVSKTKLTGKIRECSFTIFNAYGLDDIGDCIDFLVAEEEFTKKKNTIDAGEFGKGTKAALIKHIEEGNQEKALRKLTGHVWSEIEKTLLPDRKKKYR